MSIKVKSFNHITNGKTLTSVKSAQFLYQSSFNNIFQQFWNLLHIWKKEMLNFENWPKIDWEGSLSLRWKMCNVDLVELWKNGAMKYFDFFIIFLFVISKWWINKQKHWAISVNPCPFSGAVWVVGSQQIRLCKDTINKKVKKQKRIMGGHYAH